MRKLTALIAWAMATRPVRVFLHYATARGPILASGLAFQAIFSVFAAIWVGFSVLGLVLAGDTGLREAAIAQLGQAVPGLISADGSAGAIDPRRLLEPGAISWTGILALVGLLVTALGWLASTRDATRVMFDLPPLVANPVLLKLRDLAFGIGFAVLILAAAIISLVTTALTGTVLDLVGIGADSVGGAVLGRILGVLLTFVLQAVAVGGLLRVLSRIRIPFPELREGALLGALGLSVLTVLGGALLGGASSNPLLASFAVILGLLIYFNFVCQVILIAGSWTALRCADGGVVLDRSADDQRISSAIELLEGNGLAVGVPVARRRGRTRIRSS